MPWPSGGPRTWNPGETVTATQMNEQIRDPFNILKTYIDNDGRIRALYTNADAVVVSAVIAAEEVMHTYTIPANTINADDQLLEWESSGYVAATANSKTIRFYLNGVQLFTFAFVTSGAAWTLRCSIWRRSSGTTLIKIDLTVNGAATLNTATAVANAFTNGCVWDNQSVDWTTPIVIQTRGISATAINGVTEMAAKLKLFGVGN